ncbi:hypothetical protein MNBD_ALPHA08-2066, partial [hydrothermal vent metagenome]
MLDWVGGDANLRGSLTLLNK